MAYSRRSSNVRKLGKNGPLSMEQAGAYALHCLGVGAAYAMAQGVPVYVKLAKNQTQAMMRFYFPDDPAEGWVDIGPAVREEVAALLEEAFDADVANRAYDACGDRPAKQPPEAPKTRRLGRNTTPAPSVDLGAAHTA